MKLKLVISLLLVLALEACSTSPPKKKGAYYKDDGPPKGSVDMSSVKDAVPRSEAYSKTGNKPYVVFGKRYVPLKSNAGFQQKGTASWYGKKFHGKRTSSGESYDMYKMTAAHTVLPIPSYAEVTNLKNGRRVIVRINDRGPFKHDRVMDLSYAAALKLDIVRTGTGQVKIVSITDKGPQATSKAVSKPAPLPVVINSATTHQGAQGKQKIFIQIAAFSNQEGAKKLQQRLQADGYSNIKIEQIEKDGLSIYRVRMGPIKKASETDFIQADLQHDGYTGARIIVEH
jgi:rare lipoprotein A